MKKPKEKLNKSRKVNTGSSLYTALLEEDNDQQKQKLGFRNTPKPTPIYVSDVITVLPLSYSS
jgi:hypothetical protein